MPSKEYEDPLDRLDGELLVFTEEDISNIVADHYAFLRINKNLDEAEARTIAAHIYDSLTGGIYD